MKYKNIANNRSSVWKNFKQDWPILNLSTTSFNIILTSYLIIAFNSIFLTKVDELHSTPGIPHFIFMITVVLLLFIVLHFFISLITYKYLHKSVAVLILISSAACYFYMDAYGIMIDKSMLQNVLETDFAEAHEIMPFSLFSTIFLLGVIPSLFVILLKITYPKIIRGTLINLRNILVSLVMLGLIAAVYYQDYASLFRSSPFIRDLAVPINFVNASKRVIKSKYFHSYKELITMGTDAKRGSLWRQNKKRVISVLVVGETARAENFSLNGYERNTNPSLSPLTTLNLSNFTSCGTTTAISLPCMFAKATREKFDSSAAEYTENLLDIIQRAGLPVYWIDNNSGCKGVCSRVKFIDVSEENDPELCIKSDQSLLKAECYDEILIKALKKTIASSDEDMFIVLHQKGSHGPAYYLRAPSQFQAFKPACESAELQVCSQEEIINAYDNSLLYTDFVVSKAIDELNNGSDEFDSSLIYVSDHGESLGENGLFLHGMPYIIAPSQQTHVPFVSWISDKYAERFNINISCMKNKSSQEFSHDNLFSSILGWINIETKEYSQGLDIFSSCQTKGKNS